MSVIKPYNVHAHTYAIYNARASAAVRPRAHLVQRVSVAHRSARQPHLAPSRSCSVPLRICVTGSHGSATVTNSAMVNFTREMSSQMLRCMCVHNCEKAFCILFYMVSSTFSLPSIKKSSSRSSNKSFTFGTVAKYTTHTLASNRGPQTSRSHRSH